MTIEIITVDYHNTKQAQDLLFCLNAYAVDPMGGIEPLSEEVVAHLISSLQSRPHVFSVLAYVDQEPAGLINCVEGFSTFSAKPLINIHDVIVVPAFRKKGITAKMFALIEKIARAKGCCKLTLEVLEGNKVAQAAYLKEGFASYELDPKMGKAMFWQKTLS